MNVFKMITMFTVLVSLQLTMFGCGSDDGSGTPVTSKTRPLQAGDSWTFDFSVQTQSNPQITGTNTYAITRETLNGESVLATTITLNGSGASGTSSVQYTQQDPATGDIMLYGIKTGNNPVITVTDRPLPVIWPGSWEAGKSISPTIHFSDGSTDPTSYTIVGQETVTTNAGTFSTWKCVFSGSDSGTVWFSPQLGNYVKSEVISGTSTFTNTLRNTNVSGS